MSTAADRLVERALRRDRPILLAGVIGLAALSWAYMVRRAALPGMGHAPAAPGLFLLSAMWTVMMIAMMLPSASPIILTFGAEHRRRRDASHPYAPASVFLAGYLAVWTAFSVILAAVQQQLHRTALLSPAMAATSAAFAGALLVAAGVYQWTPLKDACLRHCRTPVSFLLSDWRPGAAGAFHMGVEHGLYCLGCCWLLMALPFAAGVMNLRWMAALTALILMEKALPGGERVARVAGGLLVAGGAALLISSLR